jgi:hypothetical protein
MAKTERIEFRASGSFIDRLESLAEDMNMTRADVIRTAVDTLEMISEKDREGKKIVFLPKELNLNPKDNNKESGKTNLCYS